MLLPRYGSAVSKGSRSPPVPETQLPFLSLLVLRAWKRTIPFSVPSWLHHLSPAALLLSSMAWLFSPPQFSPFCPSFRFRFLFLPLLTSSFLPSLCPLLPPHKPLPSGSPPASPSSLRLSLCSRGDMTSRASKSHISTKSYLQPSEGCVHPDTQTLSVSRTEVNTDTEMRTQMQTLLQRHTETWATMTQARTPPHTLGHMCPSTYAQTCTGACGHNRAGESYEHVCAHTLSLTRTCTHTCTRTHMHSLIHAPAHIHTPSHNAHLYTHSRPCTCTHTHTCTCTDTLSHMHLHTHTVAHIRTCTHIHMHTLSHT